MTAGILFSAQADTNDIIITDLIYIQDGTNVVWHWQQPLVTPNLLLSPKAMDTLRSLGTNWAAKPYYRIGKIKIRSRP